MWFLGGVVGFPPCCGPCSRTEARLHLSATVLRSTTLARQPGHSPQPPGLRLWFHRKAPGRHWSLGGREEGERAAFWEKFREELLWAGRGCSPKHCRAKNKYLKNDNSLLLV